MKKMRTICLKGLAIIGIIIFAYLTFFSWTASVRMYAHSEVTEWTNDSVWKNFVFLAAALAVCGGGGQLLRRAPGRILHLWAVAVAVFVAIGGCLLTRGANAYPDADQIYVYEAAYNFFTGDYHNIQTEWYFNACPYQLGLGFIYGVLLRLSGSGGHVVLQYVQSVCAGVMVYLCFRIAMELFEHVKTAVACLLCTVCFIPIYLYALYIYGETIGTCFALMGILFFLMANRKGQSRWKTAVYWGLSIAGMAIAYTMRMALLIVMIAMLVTAVLCFFENRRYAPFLLTILMLAAALGGQKLTVSVMEKNAEVELADGMPAILTVAMAIQDEDGNETGPGSYNAYNIWLYYEKGFDGEQAAEEAMRDIKRSLYRWYKNPAYMLKYINTKMLNQWNEATYGGFVMTAKQDEPALWVNKLYDGEWGAKCFTFLNLYQGMAYGMLLFYFLWLFKCGAELKHFLPGIILIGEFFFSMIWESKSRYIYPYMIIALPCVGFGLIKCSELCINGIKIVLRRFVKADFE